MFPGNANLPIGTSNTHWSAAARRRFHGCMHHDQTNILLARHPLASFALVLNPVAVQPKGASVHEKFIARQPIFDLRLRVFAYELLFRGGPQNAFQPYANASASVIADSITLFDLQLLTGHARAFVNVDELALRLGAPRLLPANRIVVEILETVQPTDEILAICRELRDAGYFFALDDFVDAPHSRPFVELAHFLKVDFQLLDPDARKALAAKYRSPNLALLAEKVETQRDLDEARSLGFYLFPGLLLLQAVHDRNPRYPRQQAHPAPVA